jgi:hypothetical protein
MGTAPKEYVRCFYGAFGSFRDLLRAFALGGLPGVQFVAVGRQIAPEGSRLALAIAKGTTVSVGASTSDSAVTTSNPTRTTHHPKIAVFVSVPVVCS